MATVTMDIAELDRLRAEITELKKKKEDILSKQKQVLILHKYFTGSIKPGESVDKSIRINGIKEAWDIDYPRSSPHAYDYFMQDISFKRAMSLGYIKIETIEDPSKVSSEYVNLDEVVSKISKEKEEFFEGRIEANYQRALKAETEMQTITEDLKKEILQLKREKERAINELQTSHNELMKSIKKIHTVELEEASDKYLKLLKAHNDLKNDKKRISFEERIAELEESLKKEQSKKWYHKLFS